MEQEMEMVPQSVFTVVVERRWVDGGVAIGVLIGNVSALCEKADLLATLEAWY